MVHDITQVPILLASIPSSDPLFMFEPLRAIQSKPFPGRAELCWMLLNVSSDAALFPRPVLIQSSFVQGLVMDKSRIHLVGEFTVSLKKDASIDWCTPIWGSPSLIKVLQKSAENAVLASRKTSCWLDKMGGGGGG